MHFEQVYRFDDAAKLYRRASLLHAQGDGIHTSRVPIQAVSAARVAQ
jgi:hypothetical protein